MYSQVPREGHSLLKTQAQGNIAPLFFTTTMQIHNLQALAAAVLKRAIMDVKMSKRYKTHQSLYLKENDIEDLKKWFLEENLEELFSYASIKKILKLGVKEIRPIDDELRKSPIFK